MEENYINVYFFYFLFIYFLFAVFRLTTRRRNARWWGRVQPYLFAFVIKNFHLKNKWKLNRNEKAERTKKEKKKQKKRGEQNFDFNPVFHKAKRCQAAKLFNPFL